MDSFMYTFVVGLIMVVILAAIVIFTTEAKAASACYAEITCKSGKVVSCQIQGEGCEVFTSDEGVGCTQGGRVITDKCE